MATGVDRTYPQLAHHNFFFSKDPKAFLDTIHRKKELPEDPNIYLVRATKTDPERSTIVRRTAAASGSSPNSTAFACCWQAMRSPRR